MDSISFVYFDLGNVICHFSHDRMARQIAQAAGKSEQTVKQHLFEPNALDKYEKGQITTAEFHHDFCEHKCTINLENFVQAASNIFSLNLSIAPLLTHLRAINFPMAILSNTCDAHWQFLVKHQPNLMNWFDRQLLSYEVGSRKPEPEIFQIAIEQAGVSPNSILFTDDISQHVQAAAAAGLQAVRFESACQLYAELLKRGVQINL